MACHRSGSGLGWTGLASIDSNRCSRLWHAGGVAAGGMSNRRGLTLAERSATVGVRARTGDEPDRSSPVGRPLRRHCWVSDPAADDRWPGLVIEWRRHAEGWRARVVYLVGDADSATTVETWVEAARLQPA